MRRKECSTKIYRIAQSFMTVMAIVFVAASAWGFDNSGGDVPVGDGDITNAGAISGVTTLDASGAVTLDGTLDANGQVDLGDGGDAVILNGSSVSVTGNTTMNNNLAVTGTTTTNGALDANGQVDLGDGGDAVIVNGSSVSVTGNTTVNNNLTVTGTTTANGTLDANGQVDLGDGGDAVIINGSSVSVTGNTLMNSDLTITGATTVNGPFDANGQVDLGDGGDTVTIDGTTVNADGTIVDITGSVSANLNGATATLQDTTGNAVVTDSTGISINAVSGDTINIGSGDEAIAIDGTTVTTDGTTVDITGATSTNMNSNGNVIAQDSTGTSITAGVGDALVVGDANDVTTVDGSTVDITGATSVNVNGATATLQDTTGNSVTTDATGVTLDAVAGDTITIGNGDEAIFGNGTSINLTADTDGNSANGAGNLSINETSASLMVNDADGDPHGIMVNQTSTTITGGTTSTSFVLDDSGATFSNTVTGGPARVTGVADGQSNYDAVNYGQLQDLEEKSFEGIAAVAALAAIPSPIGDKRFSIGVGYGYYKDENAVAFGFKGNIISNVRVTAGAGISDGGRASVNAGVGFSW